MKKRITLCCFALLATVTALAQNVIKTDTSRVVTLRVDPGHAMGGNASDIFEKINYIPLESTTESTFGKVDQLEVAEQYYIILDETTNCILFFTKAGKFHAKINGGNYQLDYFKRLRNFKVNKWTKELVVQTSKMETYIYYDFNGKKLREVPIERNKHVFWSDYKFTGKNAIIEVGSYNDDRPVDSSKINYFVSYAKDLMQKATAKALPFTTVGLKTYSDVLSARGNSSLSSGNDTSFLFAKNYDYGIYELSPTQARLKYKLIFPMQYTLPDNFVYGPTYVDKRMKYLEDHIQVIFALGNYYELANNLFFRANTRDVSFKDENLIYNLNSGSLISYERILPDESNYFLPLWEGLDFSNNGLIACDGTFLYTDFSSLSMFEAYELNKDKKLSYPKVLNDYFTKGSKKDNPVLIQLKPKSLL